MSKVKAIPKFKTEAEERAYWEKHDSSDYIDWKQARSVVMPNLKPSTKTISLRLPEGLLDSADPLAAETGAETLVSHPVRYNFQPSAA